MVVVVVVEVEVVVVVEVVEVVVEHLRRPIITPAARGSLRRSCDGKWAMACS